MTSMFPLAENAFSPEDTIAMGRAYDLATRSLFDTGQPQVVQEVIAKRIVGFAESGERDPRRLAILALRSLGIEVQI
jgi:hypothetical protein